MEGRARSWGSVALAAAMLLIGGCQAFTLSSKMVHRFSDEAKGVFAHRHGRAPGPWPRKGSAPYYQMLRTHDYLRNQRRKLVAEYQSLYFSQGNETVEFGESFGWLHYTWVDIGTPNVSFLVALDTGSDLFWVPCDCIQCAPTSASSYGLELSWCLGHLIMQDRNLSVYSPGGSSTSKHLSCSSKLCELGPNCKSKRQACPYIVQYLSDNTSSSGSLVEDVLHLASGNELASGLPIKSLVVIGCGRIQSGGFLNGGAPDGLLGLGFADYSVPSSLAKAGLVPNSFSMCFQPDDSGRIFFGDKGASNQQTTPFLALNGTRPTYIVGVEEIIVGSATVKISGFKALIDSGTSFTYLPTEVFKGVTLEFDKQVKYPKAFYEDLPWEFCYKVRTADLPDVPIVSVIFRGGSNFSIYSPILGLYTDKGTLEGFCLAVQQGEFGIIGQNFMTSYRLVFDRENLKLGWSPSDCYQLDENEGLATPAPSPQNVLETPVPLEQQTTTPAHAVSPAIAGRTPRLNHSHSVQREPNFIICLLFPFSMIVVLFLSAPWHGVARSNYDL